MWSCFFRMMKVRAIPLNRMTCPHTRHQKCMIRHTRRVLCGLWESASLKWLMARTRLMVALRRKWWSITGVTPRSWTDCVPDSFLTSLLWVGHKIWLTFWGSAWWRTWIRGRRWMNCWRWVLYQRVRSSTHLLRVLLRLSRKRGDRRFSCRLPVAQASLLYRPLRFVGLWIWYWV